MRAVFAYSRAVKDNISIATGLLAALCAVTPARGQIPSPSAASLGLGGAEVATVRGFAAIAGNPAGLGMRGNERLTISALPWLFGTSLGPVSLTDVGEWDGRFIPDEVKEGWLQRIEADGEERGDVDLQVTLLSMSRGRFGLQLSSVGAAAPELNPDAAELVLFGNEGRRHAPHDFHLAGSSIDAWMVSSLSLAYARPLDLRIGSSEEQSFSVGGTLSYLMGNVLFVGRDLGSFFSGDPLVVWLRFPMVQTDAPKLFKLATIGYPLFCLACLGNQSGRGAALNVGAQWESGDVSAGATIENVVNTFGWDVDELITRPGALLFTTDEEESGSDFDPRPANEAPDEVLASVRDFGFPLRARLGASIRRSEEVTLFGSLGARLGRATPATLDPAAQATAAVEYRRWSRVPLQAHVTLMDGGFRIGGGASTTLGRVLLSSAGSLGSLNGRSGYQLMLAASFGSR
jgi:hypothetical protein